MKDLTYQKSTRRLNLYEYGFEQAGKVGGEEKSLKLHLQEIHEGHLVDEDTKIHTSDGRKEEIRKDISEIEGKINEEKKAIESIKEVKLPDQLRLIEKFKQSITDIKKDKLGKPQVNIPLLSLMGLVFTFLSGYVYIYYLIIFYDALTGQVSDTIIPPPEKVAEAFTYNPLLLLAPVIIFSLGVVLHLIVEQKSKWKYLWGMIILLITLSFDFLIAHKIHSNINNTNDLLGLDTVHWQESNDFYIVMFMGFIVYVFWSILLHFILVEWAKRDATKWESMQLKDLNHKIEEAYQTINMLKLEIHEKESLIETFQNKIAEMREEIVSVKISKSDLMHSITQFAKGWLMFLHLDKHKEMRATCENVINEFKSNVEKSFIEK